VRSPHVMVVAVHSDVALLAEPEEVTTLSQRQCGNANAAASISSQQHAKARSGSGSGGAACT